MKNPTEEKEQLFLYSGTTELLFRRSYTEFPKDAVEIIDINCPIQTFDDILSGNSPLLAVVGVNEFFGEYFRYFIRVFKSILEPFHIDEAILETTHFLPQDIRYYTEEQVYQFLNFRYRYFLIDLIDNFVKERKSYTKDFLDFSPLFTFKFNILKQQIILYESETKHLLGFNEMAKNIIDYLACEKNKIDVTINTYYAKKKIGKEKTPYNLKAMWASSHIFQQFIDGLIEENFVALQNGNILWIMEIDKNLYLAGLIFACQQLDFIDKKTHSGPEWKKILMNTFYQLSIGDIKAYQMTNFNKMREQYTCKTLRMNNETYYFEPFIKILNKITL